MAYPDRMQFFRETLMSSKLRRFFQRAAIVLVFGCSPVLGFAQGELFEVDLTPIAFADVPVGTTVSVQRTIYNYKSEPISISVEVSAPFGPSCTGRIETVACMNETELQRASFAVDASACRTVAPRSSCVMTLSFTPKGQLFMLGLVTIQFPGIRPILVATGAGVPDAPRPGAVLAVEYYNAARDHYFLTASTIEKQILDTPSHSGWVRTGEAFWVYPSGFVDANVQPVCRFYGLPAAGLDSHFFSASETECAEVINRFPQAWLLETGDAFRLFLPDVATGGCPTRTAPVYRVFNNQTDANHRYVRTRALRDEMLSQGWIKEGYGGEAVAMCALL